MNINVKIKYGNVNDNNNIVVVDSKHSNEIL